jgi:hypothetical protein
MSDFKKLGCGADCPTPETQLAQALIEIETLKALVEQLTARVAALEAA